MNYSILFILMWEKPHEHWITSFQVKITSSSREMLRILFHNPSACSLRKRTFTNKSLWIIPWQCCFISPTLWPLEKLISLLFKTSKQKCCLLLKYHLFFTLIYCPLATSPLVLGQLIRLLWAALQGGTPDRSSGSLIRARVPPTCPLRVSCHLLGFLSLDRGQVLWDARSLSPPVESLPTAPEETGWKEKRSFSGTSLEEIASVYLKVMTGVGPGKQQLTKQNSLFSSKDPASSVLESLSCSLCELRLSLQTTKITEDRGQQIL